MKKIGICGVYGDGPDFSGGQSVKVKTMITMLSDYYGSDNIRTANTAGWRKHPIRMLTSCFRLARECDGIVILPAHNGLKVFLPLFLFLRKMRQFKLFYSVIGGWLASQAAENSKLITQLKQLDGIWVETMKMKSELQAIGIDNITIIPNVKYLEETSHNHIELDSCILRCCTFCRIIEEKGIEDAIKAIDRINEQGKYKATLDIYGPIYEGYRKKFEGLMQSASNAIHYKGCKEPSESVSILCQYDVQIFPTHYCTEGIPGSIVDSYAAAVPVVASRWNSYDDIVAEGITGLGYEMKNVIELTMRLQELCEDRSKLLQMADNCLKFYREQYRPEIAIKRIVGAMEWD